MREVTEIRDLRDECDRGYKIPPVQTHQGIVHRSPPPCSRLRTQCLGPVGFDALVRGPAGNLGVSNHLEGIAARREATREYIAARAGFVDQLRALCRSNTFAYFAQPPEIHIGRDDKISVRRPHLRRRNRNGVFVNVQSNLESDGLTRVLPPRLGCNQSPSGALHPAQAHLGTDSSIPAADILPERAIKPGSKPGGQAMRSSILSSIHSMLVS
jgi:hypothetical protein